MQSFTWLLFAFLSAFFAALVAVFGKLGLEKVDSTAATMARAGIMFLFLLLAVLFTGKLSALDGIQGRAWIFIVLAGVAGAISWLFYFWALRQGPASHVAAVDRLSIVFVVAMAVLFLGEKFDWKHGVGALLMVGGAILLALA
jgi:bacterial/archaeal transporter family protein